MLVDFAVAENPYLPPGQGVYYSNTNYILLGLIIERVTGPLGMETLRLVGHMAKIIWPGQMPW